MNILLIISAFYPYFCTRKMLQCYGVYPPMCVCAPSCLGRSKLYLLRPPTWWHWLWSSDCNCVNIFVIILCIYLPDFTHVIINLFLFACVKILVNKSVHSMRVHWNTWGRVSQAWKQVRKRDNDIPNFCNKQLFGVDAGGCADKSWQFFCTCAVVFLPK